MTVSVVGVVVLLVCVLSLTMLASGIYLVTSYRRQRGQRAVLGPAHGQPPPWNTW
ncbi:hypothetical protein [Phycicoccus avicenniae]|uniref:hypothetical protein n=1 Tax=Phycicoccus avicenniae TaxID=2828860 RepID=UPI003D282AE0